MLKLDSAGYVQAGGAPVGVRCPPPVVIGLAAPAAAPTGVEVFPNPAHEAVTVRAAGAGELVLLDALGRVVRRQQAAAGAAVRWSLAGLAPGVYVVRGPGTARRLLVMGP